MNNKTILIYYIYLILLFGGCGYVVFGIGHSGWWFLLAIVLSNISPTIKNDKDEKSN